MISLLVVNYRTAALAATAVRSARESTSEEIQVVAVDNSCDPREADALRDVADEVIVSDRNRGYAGGINIGRRACSGETIVVANPDIVFSSDAIDRLAHALRDAAVAGPALFWDGAHEWMLPPGDLNTGPEKLDEVLASRSRGWFELRDRRRIRRRIAFWSLDRTTSVRMLSGAVMAVRAAELDLAGGFDERFALYFEESDFLRRISALRRRIVYVPSARCRHMYNRSGVQVPGDAAVRYAEAEMRYLEKWNGPFVARTLKRLERPSPQYDARRTDCPIAIDREGLVVEASPYPTFATAAGHFPRTATVDVPPESWSSVGTDVLYLRTVDRASGEVVATFARYRT